jgi:hypothetical protein
MITKIKISPSGLNCVMKIIENRISERRLIELSQLEKNKEKNRLSRSEYRLKDL